MNKDKQRIAIAEACGHLNPRFTESGSCIASIAMDNDGKYWGSHGVPNYLCDLNAMHKAEENLSAIQRCQFATKLFRVLIGDDCVTEFMKIHATAEQRAEAFIRAIGKWEEGE